MGSTVDEVGRTIAGRYRIEEVIGGGGSAAVYRVTDLHDGKAVALKRSLLASSSKRSRRQELLEREFHTLAQLAHPSIIEVYDYGVDEHGAYYTMELLDGRDLHGSGPIPWQEACALLRDVASSLALLHSRGLIHRDVSARNVRRTTGGTAKLIDFGAMTAMGVAKDVVGTPPFLAPEVLQMQALDGRADLFSLGALGYYMLTGQHAFPARRFHDLRDVWRSRPQPITKAQPEAPVALNALIMQLLALDRSARLNSASEVMQRLCAIAGLSPSEHIEVSRAYLTSPVLVGRDAALVKMRRRMLALPRGDGGTLLIIGPGGSGRSRLLDVCAIEAKMVGASVLRADSVDQRSDWGVARVLGNQLVQLHPEACANASKLSREVLSQVIDGLASESLHPTSGTTIDRSLLIRELRDFVLAVARAQRLVIVIDDIDLIDEPSTALLAALAHKTERHPLVLALGARKEPDAPTPPSLRFLQLVADTIELDALVADQTEALLKSVFGAVPYLPLVAARIHALSQGSPRTIMALAQHLVDRGLARYEAGTWVMPAQLAESDLPESLSASLLARLSACSPDARELCEALCLAVEDFDALSTSDYVELTSHRDHGRVLSALDELVAARILSADRQRHRFVHQGFVAVIAQRLEPERRRALQRQLAETLARTGGDVLRRVHHLLSSGSERQALSLLLSIDLRTRYVPLELLLEAVQAAERLKRPEREVHLLRTALVEGAGLGLDIEVYREHAPTVQSVLERCSGLARYHELADLPPSERLKRALADTRSAYESLPEDERILGVQDAITALVSFAGFQRGLGLSTFDSELIHALPTLEPLMPLSPAIKLSEMALRAARESLRGRYQRSVDQYQEMLAALEKLHASGVQTVDTMRAVYGAHFVIGLIDAGRGVASARGHIEKLDEQRSYQVNAWRVRMLWHLTMGDSEEAARCRRRAELTVLREGVAQHYTGTTGLGELLCHILYEDLIALTQSVQSITHMATRFPGWKPFLVLAQGHVLRLQGDSAKALVLLMATPQPQPGAHASYPYLAALHVQLLCDAGRVSEAVKLGREAVANSEREDLTPVGYVTHVATALALMQLGEGPAAVAMIEQAIAGAEAHANGGVCIGTIYETRARIAAHMDDEAAFTRYAELCGSAYNNGKNGQLAARLSRLFEAARFGNARQLEARMSMRAAAIEPSTTSEFATLHSRMLECVDLGDRARCALTLLLQSIDSFAGYLYGINENDHVLLAALPEDEIDPALETWFAEFIEAERESARGRGGRRGGGPTFRFKDSAGRPFEPMFLIREEESQQRLAAVLVFHVTRDARRKPTRDLQEELAEQLFVHGDVTGMLLGATNTETRTR